MIADAYTRGASLGLDVWCEDEAGPFQAVPHPGPSWPPDGHPARQPHEYIRHGTAKVLPLSHPADGRVRVEGTATCPNTVLHPWLERELTAILATLPTADVSRATWERWPAGLTQPITRPAEWPALRMLLVLDNRAGHTSTALILWLFSHGVMPLFTPVGGSLAEHGREHPARVEGSCVVRPPPGRSGRDHGPVHKCGRPLECGPDAV